MESLAEHTDVGEREELPLAHLAAKRRLELSGPLERHCAFAVPVVVVSGRQSSLRRGRERVDGRVERELTGGPEERSGRVRESVHLEARLPHHLNEASARRADERREEPLEQIERVGRLLEPAAEKLLQLADRVARRGDKLEALKTLQVELHLHSGHRSPPVGLAEEKRAPVEELLQEEFVRRLRTDFDNLQYNNPLH